MSDDLTIAYMLGVEDMRSKLHKQADEIERLRAENETLRRDVRTAVMGDSAELQDVKRENEKLRKILQALINDIEDYEHINNITPKFSKLCCIESIRNAREILKKTA